MSELMTFLINQFPFYRHLSFEDEMENRVPWEGLGFCSKLYYYNVEKI